MKEAELLARSHGDYLKQHKIVSTNQIKRMKDVELASELMASIIAGSPINKKQAVDRAVGNKSINTRTLRKTSNEFSATIKSIKLMFPSLQSTRFHNLSEFYTLFMVVWEMGQQNLVLNDKSRNATAMKILQRFSDGVDAVRVAQRNAKGAKQGQRIYANYLLLVQQSTDALQPRLQRAAVIKHLLNGLFEKKDERRVFSMEQRRLLWNSEEKRCCAMCGDALNWTNFQIDHVRAYSRGGKTTLNNAALACSSCNASKGAGQKPKNSKIQKST